MSNLVETQAIVMRSEPYSETSKIVTWLTHDYGRISTIIKGGMRPNSVHFGQFDLHYKTELLFYYAANRQIYLVKEIYVLDRRPAFRTDWRAGACASYLSYLVSSTFPQRVTSPDLFTFYDETLSMIELGKNLSTLLIRFELLYADFLGIKPLLNVCASCHRSLHCEPSVFSPSRGAVACLDCGVNRAPGTITVSADVSEILKYLQDSKTWLAALNIKCNDAQLTALEHLLGVFLEFHLDTNIAVRNIAFDCIKCSFGREHNNHEQTSDKIQENAWCR
ncbi:MAG: DNA repair protein RecO [Lentisphaerae bacterium]|nr:DNA repair protein RecO [Lentisphaerota bacterium]